MIYLPGLSPQDDRRTVLRIRSTQSIKKSYKQAVSKKQNRQKTTPEEMAAR